MTIMPVVCATLFGKRSSTRYACKAAPVGRAMAAWLATLTVLWLSEVVASPVITGILGTPFDCEGGNLFVLTVGTPHALRHAAA
jgi:hypothetical protein